MNERATTLGRYRLGRLLGRGGMAEVYEAQAVGAAGVVKTVCVKRILPQYARDRRFVEMFVREAEVSMALAHGNIAQVFDFGRDEGELYLAMELVRGASLDALLRRLRRTGYLLPLPLALLVAQEVLEGLHHAHTAVDARGRPLRIVHRDVSPHNVLLSWEGEVKIVDFGIAVARGRAEETGAVPGKVAYMAPEQAAGKEVDPRADVYGVGAVLYEMLAGAAPLAGDTRQMLYALSAGRIPDLAVRAPWVPPELLEIVRRAMAPDPSARFASALAMYQALAEYAHRAGSAGSGKELAQLLGGVLGNHDQPDPKRPTPPSPELRAVLEPWRRDRLAAQARPARRRGLLLSAGALLVVSLVVGLALWLARPAMREVVVESVPPGAAIFLDDRETGETTPARLEGLERDRPYALRLQLEGYEPAAQILYPGQRQVVQSLRPILTGPAPAPAPEPVDRPESAAERRAARRRGLRDTILEKGGGEEHVVEVDLPAVAIPLSEIPALYFDLDPASAHALTIDGLVTTGLFRNVRRLVYLALGPADRVIASGMVDEDEPTRIPKGATRLAIFGMETQLNQATTGTIAVALRRLKDGGPAGTGKVSARNFLEVAEHIPALGGFSSSHGYRIEYLGPKDGPPIFFVGTGKNPLTVAVSRGLMMGWVTPRHRSVVNFASKVYLFCPVADAAPKRTVRLRFVRGPTGKKLSRGG